MGSERLTMAILENDAERFPYAQDLDGAWHRRPVGDTWNSDQDSTQCRTVCDQAIYSVHVSEYEPVTDQLCGGCFPGQ